MALAKVDSKGRVSLPREIQDIVGNMVEITPVGKDSAIIQRAKRPGGGKKNKMREFAKLLDKDPRRTGNPQNPSTDEMKSIWNE
jgi:bifunctional DNA-binding transcriptional regulator/antitoxin component of YhaV-PrlF toxin-antitoxin module